MFLISIAALSTAVNVNTASVSSQALLIAGITLSRFILNVGTITFFVFNSIEFHRGIRSVYNFGTLKPSHM